MNAKDSEREWATHLARACSGDLRARDAALGAASAPSVAAAFGQNLEVERPLRRRLDALLADETLWALELVHRGLGAEARWAKDVFLDALAAGQSWSIKALQAWYGPPVRSRCRLHLRDSTLADEVASDVCSDFSMSYAGNERARVTFPGYLFKMARTYCQHRLRRSSRYADHVDAATLVGDGLDPEQSARRSEQSAHLQGCLSALSAEDRDLLRARYADELKLRELAEARGISHQAVDKRIRKLLARLRDCLIKRARTEGATV